MIEIQADQSIPLRRWTRITASYEPQKTMLNLTVVPLVTAPGDRATAKHWTGSQKASAKVGSNKPVTFAARLRGTQRDQHFDGRLDACGLGSDPAGEPDVQWDFSVDIGSDLIRDTRPHQLHGQKLQLPARATPGIQWTGQVHDWTVDPRQYGAIYFHSDDIANAEWETSCRFVVGDYLPSGVYASRSRTETSEDYAVFFVSPRAENARPKIAWLAPTITYRAYENIGMNLSPERIFGSWEDSDLSNDRFCWNTRSAG